MKSYTDLEQSKKLSNILQLKGADMYYDKVTKIPYYSLSGSIPTDWTIPCWSLAALLGIIRKAIGYTLQTTYNDKDPKVFMICELGDKPYSIESLEYDNEVDACIDIIEKLNEFNCL